MKSVLLEVSFSGILAGGASLCKLIVIAASKKAKIRVYKMTRRHDPDKYCNFDALCIFDYYSKGKDCIKKGTR